MPSQIIYFDADSLLRLMTHYTEGEVPLDSKLIEAGVSAKLGRWIGLLVESDEWKGIELDVVGGGLKPLQVRYEGKKVLSWGANGDPLDWKEGVEAPKT